MGMSIKLEWCSLWICIADGSRPQVRHQLQMWNRKWSYEACHWRLKLKAKSTPKQQVPMFKLLAYNPFSFSFQHEILNFEVLKSLLDVQALSLHGWQWQYYAQSLEINHFFNPVKKDLSSTSQKETLHFKWIESCTQLGDLKPFLPPTWDTVYPI